LNEEILRLESSFWSAKNDKNIQTIKGVEIIDLAQYGTSKELNEHNEGYLTLRINEFENIFITTPSKSCDLLTESDYESLKLKAGDVLISRTNGNPNLVGKAAVVMENTSFVYASYLFKIRPKKEIINAETLTVFLNSKYGRNEINKYSMTSNQTNFSPAKFREIDIPLFPNELQNQVQNNVMISYQKLEESKKLYTKAEALLLSELGLNNFAPSDECVAVKSFSESFGMSGRLDAEYYQLKYDDIIDRIKSYRGGYKKLGAITTLKKSIEPGSDAYGDEGVQFLRVADLFKYELKEPEIRLSESLFDAEKLDDLKPKYGEVLLSKDGSVGIAYTVREDTNFIPSGAIVRLQEITDILPDVLALILNSQVVQLQAERDAGGSILQHWKPSEINEVLVPLLDEKVQKIIAEKISESFTLRAESKRLLEEAKMAVERAIEHGETI